MTDKEIKDLAQKIAKLLYDEDESYNGILWWSVEPKERKAEELEMTLKVLLRDHCIVSKEKVKALCRLTVENSISIDYGLIDGLTDLVCEMFNEEYHKEIDDYDLYLKGGKE